MGLAKLLIRYGADPEISDSFRQGSILQMADKKKMGMIR